MEAKRGSLEATSRFDAQPREETFSQRLGRWLEDIAPSVFIWPAVLTVLFLAVFPLFVSLYLAFARVQLVVGGYEVEFIGFTNFEKLFFGSGRRNFLGRWDRDASFLGLPGMPTAIGWLGLIVLAGFLVYMLYRHGQRREYTPVMLFGKLGGIAALAVGAWYLTNWLVAAEGPMAGMWLAEQYWLLTVIPGAVVVLSAVALGVISMVLRLAIVAFMMGVAWLTAITLTPDGLPGTMVVTLVFVFCGVALQYVLGLGLALLVTQNLPGKRFFRVVFLLPMLITPVGIGFLFRMMTDTLQGPLAPLWAAAGLTDFSWVETATGARAAIIIADTWQWTPFMFIILLAALEGISNEPIEAALVDGANRWQLFRFIILPAIIPVSITLILIRTIEAFKIVDLPRIMTNGGPGTATESVTLFAFNQWKASATSIGYASSIAYLLLIISTFFALVLVNIGRRRLLELFE